MPSHVIPVARWAATAALFFFLAPQGNGSAHAETHRVIDSKPSLELPRLVWIWGSAGLTLDHWSAQEFSPAWNWETKTNQVGFLNNNPQSLLSAQLGAKWVWQKKWGFTLAAPYFWNTRLGMGNAKNASEQGLGSPQLTLDYRNKKVSVGLQATVPGLHTVSVDPWTDFNVFRLALPIDWSSGGGRAYLQPSWIIASPSGDGLKSGGLVDAGDYEIHAGYSHSKRLSKHWKGRLGVDYGLSSYHFARFAEPNQTQSVQPSLALSWLPFAGHEISLSAAGTFWSHESGAFTDASVSKKISLGLYYGRYL